MKRKRVTTKQFKGDCFAIEMREYEGENIEISVLVEDDSNWFTSLRFSHFWLPELYELLGQTIRELGNNKLKIPLSKEK